MPPILPQSCSEVSPLRGTGMVGLLLEKELSERLQMLTYMDRSPSRGYWYWGLQFRISTQSHVSVGLALQSKVKGDRAWQKVGVGVGVTELKYVVL